MVGFCKRCGDIIRGSDSRCKCGGSSASSQVTKAMFEIDHGTPKRDRWLKTYGERRSLSPASALVSKPPSKSPIPSQLHRSCTSLNDMASQPHMPTFSQPRDKLVDRDLNIPTSEAIISSTSAHVPDPKSSAPKEVRRGLSVKSSARAHVRSLTANMPDSVDLSAAEEEVLTNVFGSVLDPNETRGRCGACQQIFKREGKIYPDPRREDESGKWAGVFYCRKCYVQRFSRGKCASCNHIIVGDEGPCIQLGKDGCNGLWHKKCFKCVHCHADVSNKPSVDLSGNPCCEECFEKPCNRISSKFAMVTDIPDLRVKSQISDRVKRTSIVNSPAAKVYKSAVDELRNKLRDAGIEKQHSRSSSSRSSHIDNDAHSNHRTSLPASSAASPSSLVTIRPLTIAKPASKPQKLDPASALPKPSFRSSPKLSSASAQHVLSPSANPLCPTCKLPLFRPSCDPSSLPKSSTGPSHQFCRTLATLPATGETFHINCLTCDDCNQTFPNQKYVLLDNLKLCEACIGQRDLAAVKERLEKTKTELAKRREDSVPTRYYRKSLATNESHSEDSESVIASFPASQPHQSSSTARSNQRYPPPSSHSASENPEQLKRVSTSPFLGGSHDNSFKLPIMSKSLSATRFGGQAMCPGCSKPGTMTETKLGPNNERWHFKCLQCTQCHKPLDSGAKTFDDSKDVGCRDCLGKARAMKRANPLTAPAPLR